MPTKINWVDETCNCKGLDFEDIVWNELEINGWEADDVEIYEDKELEELSES